MNPFGTLHGRATQAPRQAPRAAPVTGLRTAALAEAALSGALCAIRIWLSVAPSCPE
jgi:hypothetical protein